MRNLLLRFILIAFLVSVADPATLFAYQQNQTRLVNELKPYKKKLSIKAIVKAAHYSNTDDLPDHGSKLPRWAGGSINDDYNFAVLHNVLFLQNTHSVVFKQQYFNSLLFPKHFFS